MERKNKITSIISKFYSNEQLSVNELKKLERWLDHFDQNEEVAEWLTDQWINADSKDHPIAPEPILAKIKQLNIGNLSNEVEQTLSLRRNKRKRTFYWTSVAASILVIIAIGISITKQLDKKEKEFTAEVIQTQPDLPDDKSVVLSIGEDQQYRLTEQELKISRGNTSLTGNNNQLVFNQKSEKDTIVRIPVMNTIKVPKGKDYYLELSDGTKVWINAGSTLRFPDFFNNNTRKVELIGEAYFDVKSDLLNPFFIKTLNSTICVTGTEFNICNYSEDIASTVTLVEGKVNVVLDQVSYQLSPGQQFKINNASKAFAIDNVDTDLYTGWKTGMYEFKDITLAELTERLEKWYDVQFQFEKSSLEQLRFTGMVKKEKPIEYFLNVLDKTTNIEFNRINHTILIQEAP